MAKELPRIKMIHIESLVDSLMDLWNRGVEYVDIVGDVNENGIPDEVCLSFLKEYMDKGYEKDFDALYEEIKEAQGEDYDDEDEEEEEPKPTQQKVRIKLTDKDIDDLI